MVDVACLFVARSSQCFRYLECVGVKAGGRVIL